MLLALIGASLAAWRLEVWARRHAGRRHAPRRRNRTASTSNMDIRDLSGGAVAIALVSFADISVLSRVFTPRGSRETDRDQELIALGAAA